MVCMYSPPSSICCCEQPHNTIQQRGNDFLRPLVILEQSKVEGLQNAEKIAQLIAKGDNVIIMSNHQTEADPQVWTRLRASLLVLMLVLRLADMTFCLRSFTS